MTLCLPVFPFDSVLQECSDVMAVSFPDTPMSVCFVHLFAHRNLQGGDQFDSDRKTRSWWE